MLDRQMSGSEFLQVIRDLFGRRALRTYREGAGVSSSQIYRWTKAATVPRYVQTTCELLCALRNAGLPLPAGFEPRASSRHVFVNIAADATVEDIARAINRVIPADR